MEAERPIGPTTRRGKPLNESEKRAALQAQTDREDIAALRRLPAWERYYMRRVRQPYEESLEKVLHDTTLTPEELYRERLVFQSLERTVKLLEVDDANCRRILGVGED